MSVVKRGSGYATVHCHGKDKGKTISEFDTKREAMAQHRAIEASKHRDGVRGAHKEARKK